MAYQTHVQIEEDARAQLEWLIDQANRRRDAEDAQNNSDDGFIEHNEMEVPEETAPAAPPLPQHTHDAALILQDLGYMRKVSLKEEDRSIHYIIPEAAFFANRGEELWQLSRMEYAALVDFKDTPDSTTSRIKQFLFGEGFICQAQKIQFLRAKQQTVMVTRKPPRHPGIEPDPNSETHPQVAGEGKQLCQVLPHPLSTGTRLLST